MSDNQEKKLYVKMASPFETYYEGEAFTVSAMNDTGPFDVLPDHANFISILQKCTVQIFLADRKVRIPIERGIVKVFNNNVQLFVDV
ncbi:MAG: hypothetical protein R3346_01070 [Candidatus Spechtbacterales bacterium]|nr:hypothetical protein [Candidatus Spechtbacterales bacterium]